MGRRKSSQKKQSTKKKQKQKCPISTKHTARIERHHVIPRSDKRFQQIVNDKRRALTILLCADCHKLVHDIFGPGDEYTGPITVKHLLKWLRIKNNTK